MAESTWRFEFKTNTYYETNLNRQVFDEIPQLKVQQQNFSDPAMLKVNHTMDKPNTQMASMASQICNQISSIFTNPTSPLPPPLDTLVDEISSAWARKAQIFIYGVGRECLMLKALTMRLFHLGLSAHFVFDMTTPPISSRDLLIASAGPGGFSTVDAICRVSRSNGARVVLLTAQPVVGSCVEYASVVGYIPAQTMADDRTDEVGGSRPLLPMGSLYEGALFVLFEMVVYKLAEVLGESDQAIRSRHTNLE